LAEWQHRSAFFFSAHVREEVPAAPGVMMIFDDMPEQSETDDLGAQVIRVIAQTQRIPAERISLDSTFEELKIDSLDGINIIFALENEFGVNIPDEGLQNMRSVRETVGGVRTLIAEKSAAAPPGAA
jgi:acyl carrier protein